MAYYDNLLADGILPDFLIRFYVRRFCRIRLRNEPRSIEKTASATMDLVEELRQQPLAIEVDAANLQHYEVPTEFFQTVLGPHLKYSCCYWEGGDLEQAEKDMLARTCERAALEDGQDVLELGCGWGSLSLFMAARFPNSRITAVSNSSTQKAHIDAQAQKQGLSNLTILTADMNTFEPSAPVDRVVSIEMFEHMRNYGILFQRIHTWLRENGKVFIHVFTYDGMPYLYDAEDPEDWMARNFFAGGTMPSPDLFHYFSGAFELQQLWQVNGQHYEKTLNCWLKKMDSAKNELFPLFEKEYGKEAKKYWNHWRVFFMSCAEVFGYHRGNKWFVSHYLFSKIGT